jgi:subtilisin family serine protease
MSGTGRRWAALLLAAAGLLVLVSASAGALDVSTKAIKAVGSHEYQNQNVEAYANQLSSVEELDGREGAIAVLDTGVDDEHPTFGNAFVAGAQYYGACDCVTDSDPVTDEGPVNPNDGNGHGTHVASIALGRGTDDGPRGVADGAALVDVKIASDLGSVNAARIAEGIDWVLDYNDGGSNWTQNPVPVEVIVVASASTQPQDERAYDDAAMEAVERAYDDGVLVVAAAGNCGPDTGNVSSDCTDGGAEEDRVASPAATPEALAVGAVDDNESERRTEDQVDGYSSRGPNPADNASDETWRKPDLVAPGTDVTAACQQGLDGDWQMDCTESGTSMAAPHVAGTAMLVHHAMVATDQDPSPADLADAMTSTALDIDDEGWDPVSGHGYVDAYEAVVDVTNNPPNSDFNVQPPDPSAGEQVVLDAGPSEDPDDGDRIDRFVWTVDGETEKLSGDQETNQVVFNETGTHSVELSTIDTRGAEDPDPARATIHVSEPETEDEGDETDPPDVALAHGPSPAETGQEVWFDANNSTDPDGQDLLGYAWDFDANGSFQADEATEGPRTTKTFDEPGEHVVRVRVTDDSQAQATANVTVEVTEPEQEPPRVAITNPQEGDVVETGTVNVTWTVLGGPVDTFGVSVDTVAVDQTAAPFLEITLGEDDSTIAVKATGPGGDRADRVNVSVVEDESLDQASSEDADDANPNPPRHTDSPSEDEDATDDDTTEEGSASETDAGDDASASDDPDEVPGPGLAAALAGLLAATVATRRSR